MHCQILADVTDMCMMQRSMPHVYNQ